MFSVATNTLNNPANSISAPGIGESASREFSTVLVENTSENTPKIPIPAEIKTPMNPMFRNMFNVIAAITEMNSPIINPRGAENVRFVVMMYPVIARNTAAVTMNAASIICGAYIDATHRIGDNTIPDTNPSNTSAVTPNAGLLRHAIATHGTTFSITIATTHPIVVEKKRTIVSDVAPTYPPAMAQNTLTASSMYVCLITDDIAPVSSIVPDSLSVTDIVDLYWFM